MTRFRLIPLIFCGALVLAGCESSEERAERHFQSAVGLLAEGKVELALIDLRRVFEYNGLHKAARQLYADTVLAQGKVGEAYSQFLRLVEQYPDTPEARLTLAELAFRRNDWDETARHGEAAIALVPEDPRAEALAAALAYRKAALAEDAAGMAAAAQSAAAVLEREPDNGIARRIVVDSLVTSPDPLAALPEIDAALEREPEALDLHVARLNLLARAQDTDEIGAQLQRMYALFPEDEEIQSRLIRWLLSQQDVDAAEAVVREIAARQESRVSGAMTVVRFLGRVRGLETARAELDRLIAETEAGPDADMFRALAANIDFASGDREAAIAEMRAILTGAEPSDRTRDIEAQLAQMLTATDAEAEARALVEKILAEDASHVLALKLRAGWHIADDRPGDAIIDLRAALDQAPRDADILTLMAQAHERDGSLILAGERLALAVEASGGAAAESLRYVQFLLREGRLAAAKSVLQDARRVAPSNLELLRVAAGIALREEDLAALDEIVATLRTIDRPEARAFVSTLETTRLLAEGEVEAGAEALQSQLEAGGAEAVTAGRMLALVRFVEGDAEGAYAALDAALEAAPDGRPLNLLRARLQQLQNDPEAAAATLRAILAESPGWEPAVRPLHALLQGLGRAEEASALLATGLEAAPESVALRMMRAVELNEAGDIDGAIAVFEALYAEDSSNLLVANNLASLLGAHRDDPAALERAFAIARRLRGRDVPAFQDTYGWIEYRRGNLDEALAHLEPAAAGLPEDPLVQYHLGMTYLALERTEEARAQLDRALELAGPSPLPQFDRAREALQELPPPPPQ